MRHYIVKKARINKYGKNFHIQERLSNNVKLTLKKFILEVMKMKGTKRLSFLVAMIIAITNIAFIGIPSVGAEVISSIVSDDFETGYTAISSNAAATLEGMQELCDMKPWWYSSKATTFNKAEDIVEGRPLIASVVNAGDNNVLRLTYHAEAGIGTNITTPDQANWFVSGAGSYEISFRFYSTKDMQILGIGGKVVDGSPVYYKNNILTKVGNSAYMGDTETSSPAGVGGSGINSNAWYTLKVVVNNDQGYYSVEIFDASGNSLQRVGGINFQDGCPAFSNIRFHAPTADSVVYIDDYQVKAVNTDTLVYEDDFNIYSGLSGTTTAGANLFKEISQFRVINTASAFALGTNDTGKYFVLNKNANATYMPWNGHILTKESQALRGKLQMKFSFAVNSASAAQIKKTSASFRVMCADNLTSVSTLTDTKYTMFRVQPFSSGSSVGYGVQKSEADYNSVTYDKNKFQLLTADKWYDVQLTFDLVNDNVTMEFKEQGTNAKITFERSTGLYNGGTPLESIKSIAIQATDGMIIGVDDFEVKYVQEGPQVNASGIEIVDYNGERVLPGAKDVHPAIAGIKIPFTQAVTDESVGNITLKAEGAENAFDKYTTTNANGVYTMSFDKTLEPNTKYTLSVPTTVTNAEGVALVKGCTYEFTTGADKDLAEMAIKSIDVNNVELKNVEDLANGDKIYVRMKYANTTNTLADCLMIIAYYDANNALLGSSAITGDLSSNSINMTFAGRITVPAAEVLDLSKVNKVSIYLWDSYGNIRPYCEHVDIFRTTADSE